jgi:hypothetical protein
MLKHQVSVKLRMVNKLRSAAAGDYPLCCKLQVAGQKKLADWGATALDRAKDASKRL